MSELCLTITAKTRHFSSLVLSHLFHFSYYFIISHPLYFSYFIFFSPYLLKLLSFLSPLFITTSLLFILLQDTISSKLSDSEMGFFLSAYLAVIERLDSKNDKKFEEFEEYCHFDGFEAFRIVFDTSIFDVGDNPIEVTKYPIDEKVEIADTSAMGDKNAEGFVKDLGGIDKNEEGFMKDLGGVDKIAEGFLRDLGEVDKIGEGFLEDLGENDKNAEGILKDLGESDKNAEGFVKDMGEIDKNAEAQGTNLNKVDDPMKKPLPLPIVEDGGGGGGGCVTRGMEGSKLCNYGGTMGKEKEKEWRRTLACKLFEERHNVGGSEGMDSLWETYELAAINKNNNMKKNLRKKKIEEFSDEEDNEDRDGGLCCLQALKFSAGKMNLGLGMGKPNLMRISKAIKGFGWLHHVSRHGKKKCAK